MLNTRLHQKKLLCSISQPTKDIDTGFAHLLFWKWEWGSSIPHHGPSSPVSCCLFSFYEDVLNVFCFVISVGMGFHFKWDVFSSVSSVSSEESKPGWFRSQVMKTLSGSFAEGDRSSLLNVSCFRPVNVVTSDNVALKVIWDSTGSTPSLWNLTDALKQSCALPLR